MHFSVTSRVSKIGRSNQFASLFLQFVSMALIAIVGGMNPVVASISEPLVGASWIAPPDTFDSEASCLFRKEFSLEALPKRAVLRIVGLGDYDPVVNGERLASVGMNQPWSQYEKAIYYRDYDVSKRLRSGDNCLGVTLTNSFWHNLVPSEGRYFKSGPQRTADEPKLLCAELLIESIDGGKRSISTDSTWRTDLGPIVFSHIFAGEDYDARKAQKGWSTPGFEDSAWHPVRTVQAPAAELRSQQWPSIEAHERFTADSISESAPGVWLYSFPQNCSAQVRVKLSGGQPGTEVQLRCGEHRSTEGRIFGHYPIESRIITDGQSLERQWTSFYFGMQFVELQGAVPRGQPNPKGLPIVESLELVHVRTSMRPTGSFSCSSDVYNGTHRIVDWAMRSNASFVMTDCPHREKLGWLEQAYLMAPSFFCLYDCGGWFSKIEQDIRDAQLPNGRVLTVAPSYPGGRFPDAFNWTVEWGAAAVQLPWRHYEATGDKAVLEANFESMQRFVDRVQEESTDGLAPGGLGDWYDYGHGHHPGPSRFTPTELTATACWAMCAKSVARTADALGQGAIAKKYHALHAQIGEDFRRHYRDPSTGKITNNGSPQCANAMALCAEIAIPEDRDRLVEEIITDLEQRDWQQTPGDIGHVYFIRALAEAGRSDVLHRVYSRQGVGSYGGVLSKGLTAMPETWDAMMDGYQSLNHCMLGHAVEWFYGYVAGIRQAPGSVGWDKILIAPVPGSLNHAEATLQTPKGVLSSRWKVHEGQFHIEIEVPPGATASTLLPSGKEISLRAGYQEFIEPFATP